MAEKRYVSAKDGKNNSVIYKAADGSEYLHSGGTRAWRNNNPGNLKASEKSGRSIGSAGTFAVFPTYEDGLAGLRYSLTQFYAKEKLGECFKRYAPSKDNNNPEHYAQMVKQFSGLDSNRTVGALSDDELKKFMAAIQRVEGWKAGKIEPIPYAQQFAVTGVDGKPLSGLAYVMSFFTSKGEEKKIKGTTDAEGKTQVAQTDTRSPVSLKLPRPDPGQSLKGSGVKAKADAAPQVVAAEVKAKPWYECAYSTCADSEDERCDGPLSAKGDAAAASAVAASAASLATADASAVAVDAAPFAEPIAAVPIAGATAAPSAVQSAAPAAAAATTVASAAAKPAAAPPAAAPTAAPASKPANTPAVQPAGPAGASATKPAAPAAPIATVKQGGAVQASATVNKAANLVQQVVKDDGVFITWEFDTSGGSQKKLKGLPYFIAEMSGNTSKPLLAGQGVGRLPDTGKIRQKVPFGKEVALYLGNDAKAKYRKYPLYRVAAEEGVTDVMVKVAETAGPGYDSAKEVPFGVEVSGTKKTFKARLYGTTWMKFSHKFTEAEASAEGAGESQELRDALEKIYRGAPTIAGTASIVLSVTKPNQKQLKILWPRSAFQNCFSNIGTHTDLAAAKQEFIPRVNPQTYKAFLKAAFEMDADELEISSGWRPMLGSVLHRLGIGLDVNRLKIGSQDKAFSRNATGAELEYRQLMSEKATLSKKKDRTPAEIQRLNEIKAVEAAKSNAAIKAIYDNESSILRSFTSKLRANGDVKQTFDPWEMDVDTGDKVPQSPNRITTDNEKLHRTHLHITVRDTELGH